jgi:hypothetical protein
MVLAMRVGLLVMALSGCVSIPPYQGTTQDASPDVATTSPLAARMIGNAYRNGAGAGTSGMSATGFTIPTTGIVDGDLVLFIANVDNGADNFWNLPAGFQVIANRHNGQDGQSYVFGYKIAASEPTLYTGTYGPSSTSAAATVSLVAVTGYDPVVPINVSLPWDYPDDADPANISTPGVTTTVDNTLLIYAAGVDWHGEDGQNTYVPPDGFTMITTLGDEVTKWQWTSQMIASKVQPASGATGMLADTTLGVKSADTAVHIPGAGWTVLVAIAPAH